MDMRAGLSATRIPRASPPPGAEIDLLVNGQRRQLMLDLRTSLLDALREHLHLTGTKKGCTTANAAPAPSSSMDGESTAALTLAVMHGGDQITTIEGLGDPDHLHPMQAAFVEHDGFQCGYCTPGQICSAVAVLDEVAAGVPSHVTADLSAPVAPTEEEIRERMSGNICRCAAYPNIVEAVRKAAGDRA